MSGAWVELDAACEVVRRAPELVERLVDVEPLEVGLARLRVARPDFEAALARRAGAVRLGFGRAPLRRVFDVDVHEGTSGPRLVFTEVDPAVDPAAIPALLCRHLEQHPDAFVVTDPDGVMAWCDDDLPALLGWGRDELMGRSIEALRARSASTEADGCPASLAAHGHYTGVSAVRRADGEELPIRHTATALSDPAGRVLHQVHGFQDLRRVREVERLSAVARTADALALQRERLAHAASEVGAELLALAEGGMEGGGDRVRRILALAGRLGPDHPAVTDPEGGVDLHGLARDLVAALGRVAPEGAVRLAPATGPAVGAAPAAELARMLLRLGLRALDGAAQGPVTLAARAQGDRVGVELQYRPSREEPGTLAWLFPRNGLSSEAHTFLAPFSGSEVEVAAPDKVDPEVRILVSVPRAPRAVPSLPPVPVVSTRARLLVVEDNERFRELVVEALGDQFQEVLAVGSAEEALAAVAGVQGEVAVALVDLGLPGMGGLALLGELRARWPGIAALVSSGLPGPGVTQEARAAGARLVLLKPYRLGELRSIVRSLLAAR